LVGCAHATADEELLPTKAITTTTNADVAPVRAQRDGRGFPEGVLALTWDDGPDLSTLALGEYLRREHVSATFFVIGGWKKGVSSDPGFGARVYETGHEKLPLLADLVALGHRIGNHTHHHVLLGHVDATRVDAELREEQQALDPILRNELRLFRVPGGEWAASASRAVDRDPLLAQMIGPIRWDVDAKDWEGSVWCESSRPSHECEHQNGRWRVRADVMAARYERAIDSRGRGIVLMHDRVGDVGSEYALDMARLLIPRLEAKGYVFAAPVLAFGAPRSRYAVAGAIDARLGDVDGDGRADVCVREGDEVSCPMSSWHTDEQHMKNVTFDPAVRASAILPSGTTSFELADVTGDGRADLCVRTETAISCAASLPSGTFGAFETWTRDLSDAQFADVDGDGKADACGRSPFGVVCAKSTGSAFESPRLWLAAALDHPIALGDVNGDGRADVCTNEADGMHCALSTRVAFAHYGRWSREPLENAMLADLNGDGRADVCASTPKGFACALSNGRGFVGSSTWLDAGTSSRAQWARLGDVNGDGRADYCDIDGEGIRCGLAP
jgi:peptidoglycan/xylan/chitin deacetylase (PgdA/CDA1 family)